MHRYPQRGFTIFELMLSIALMALLTAFAVPSFRQYTANTRTSAATNGLITEFAIARSEALRRSLPVSVCASSDSATCDTVTPDWTKGWIVFTDGDGTQGVLDGTDLLLQAWPAAGPKMTLTSTAAYVQYTPSGMNAIAAKITFTAASSGCTGNHKAQIVVSATGSPQSSYIACP